MTPTTMLYVLLCISLHIATIALLAVRHDRLFSPRRDEAQTRRPIHANTIKAFALVACASTLLLPYQFKHLDELSQCGIRVVCFFYACKTLELALCRSAIPPRLVNTDMDEDHTSRAKYIWLLLAEMRYHSFDTAVLQRHRPPTIEQSRSIAGPFIAALSIGCMNYYILPLAELKCLCLLLLLQAAFEGLHALVHPSCEHPLFYRPASASSMGAFWATHWHACAGPFLYSLGYKPGKRILGRWFGVLATFGLSGLWHGWAAAALVDDSHALVLGGQVWGLFMLFGVMCLVEGPIWGSKQGGMVQRVVVWVIPVLAAGQCFRTLERHTSIQWLRR